MSDATNIVSGAFRRGEFSLDVDLSWDERVLVVFGRSGAGKSSLFELILGLDGRREEEATQSQGDRCHSS